MISLLMETYLDALLRDIMLVQYAVKKHIHIG